MRLAAAQLTKRSLAALFITLLLGQAAVGQMMDTVNDPDFDDMLGSGSGSGEHDDTPTDGPPVECPIGDDSTVDFLPGCDVPEDNPDKPCPPATLQDAENKALCFVGCMHTELSGEVPDEPFLGGTLADFIPLTYLANGRSRVCQGYDEVQVCRVGCELGRSGAANCASQCRRDCNFLSNVPCFVTFSCNRRRCRDGCDEAQTITDEYPERAIPNSAPVLRAAEANFNYNLDIDALVDDIMAPRTLTLGTSAILIKINDTSSFDEEISYIVLDDMPVLNLTPFACRSVEVSYAIVSQVVGTRSPFSPATTLNVTPNVPVPPTTVPPPTLSPLCEENTVRLAGGRPTRGRVEICLNGVFGTVCDDLWGDRDATVVCRQLGFNTIGFGIQVFGGGTGPIYLDDVGCSGSENSLIDCPNSGIGIHDCDHSEDAGVDCGSIVVGLDRDSVSVSEGNAGEVCVLALQNPFEEEFRVFLRQDFFVQDEFQITPAELLFRPGELARCFEVQALKDFTLEETIENFVLESVIETFSSSYLVNGFNNTLSLEIVDTDFVIIDAAVRSVDVMEGSVVEACAVRGLDSARILDRPVVLRVVGFPTGATPGVDFSFDAIIPLVFEFPDDSPIVCRPFEIFQDDIPEPDPESVTLVLQAFDIAIVIPQPFTTFNIIDDDGPTGPPPTTLPPLPDNFLTFVGDTPTVNGTTVTFTIDSSARAVECRFSEQFPCAVGVNQVTAPEGDREYTLRVTGIFPTEELEVRRDVFIPIDSNECSVVLINDGLTINGRILTAEFGEIGTVGSYTCRVDQQNRRFPCTSPLRINLAAENAGPHFLRIVPEPSAGCNNTQGQSFDFELE